MTFCHVRLNILKAKNSYSLLVIRVKTQAFVKNKSKTNFAHLLN